MLAHPVPRHRLAAVVLFAAAVALPVQGLHAQDGVERKVLLRHDLDMPGREALVVDVRIAAGAREGRHTHAGTALATVVEGELVFETPGQPPRTLHAGEAIAISPGQVHEGINRSNAPVRLLATFIVEKGQPLTTPAP